MSLGYYAIKRKRVRIHFYCMTTAFVSAAVFLILFILKYFLYGATAYSGQGLSRWILSAIFYTHEPLAVINVPLVMLSFLSGFKKRFRTHRELAYISFAIWCYVSVTGILIAIFLYL